MAQAVLQGRAVVQPRVWPTCPARSALVGGRHPVPNLLHGSSTQFRPRAASGAGGESFDQQGPPDSVQADPQYHRGEKRRRGRPAHLRSPDDSPLRDGNRDRLMGLLTERAARTLAYYFSETNPSVSLWVHNFIKGQPIPRDGNWDDVSGDTFLRTLLSMPMSTTKLSLNRDPAFDNMAVYEVDPRSLAIRIMEIRSQLANEFIEDLKLIKEDNKALQLETLQASLLSTAEVTRPATASMSSTDEAATGSTQLFGRRAEEEARHRTKMPKKKPSFSPTNTPPNWRMRVEVEEQVHGPGGIAGSEIPDSIVRGQTTANKASAAAPPPPPAVEAGPIASSATSPAPSPVVPPQPVQQQQQQQPLSSTSGSSSTSGTPPPAPKSSAAPLAALHPEIAELLPMIKDNPKGLTTEVAHMLSNAATMSNGRLHPAIADAVRTAVAAGAVLHPEVAELLGRSGTLLLDKEPKQPKVLDISEDTCLHSDEE